MRSIYCSTEWQNYLVENVQNPAKVLIRLSGEHRLRFWHLLELIRIYRSIKKMPEPTKDNVFEHNSRLLLDIRDDFFRHFNCQPYSPIFRWLFNILVKFYNYFIMKHSFDSLYKTFMDWFVGQMLLRGWELPAVNRPDSPLWDKIPLDIRFQIEAEIRVNHDRLMKRYETIRTNPGDAPKDDARKEARYQAFMERLLLDIEKYVAFWKEVR